MMTEIDFDALRDTRAPDTLAGSVLVAAGLADAYFQLETPIGPIYVAFNSTGISSVSRAGDRGSFESAFQAYTGRRVVPGRAPRDLRRAVEAHLAGEWSDLHFDLRGLSEFERAVLLKALEIPRGQVKPYAWVAREIGRPRAMRAVGNALAHNPIPLLIPCHRVVRSDGKIGQYGMGGPEVKRQLLEIEGVAQTLPLALRAG